MNPHPHLHKIRSGPKKNPYKLGWFQSLTLYSSLGVLFVSGVALKGVQIGSAFQQWMLWLHGWAVPVFLLSFGALLAKHVPAAWKANRNRISGAIVVGVCALLIVTGGMLHYVGSDYLREKTIALHYWVGILLAPLLIFHAVAGLLERKKREKSVRH